MSRMAWPTEASSGHDDFLNYFGATIFWLYIAAALYFSVIVILPIYNVPTPGVKRSSLQQRVMKDVAHFSALAGASFGALSVNMLNILYQSYLAWSGRHRLRASLSVSQIWRWSITTTLFQDFGEAIVQHPVRYFWTHSALVTTLAVSFFMGTAGKWCYVPRFSCHHPWLTHFPARPPTSHPTAKCLFLPRPDPPDQLHAEFVLCSPA